MPVAKTFCLCEEQQEIWFIFCFSFDVVAHYVSSHRRVTACKDGIILKSRAKSFRDVRNIFKKGF